MNPDEILQHESLNSPASSEFVRVLMRRLSTLLSVATVALAIVSLATLAARHHWLTDICANLRVQCVIGLLAVACGSVVTKSWRLFSVQIMLLIFHAPWFAVVLFPDETPTGPPQMTFATANVLTANRRYDEIEAQLLASNADVVAVLELSTPLRDHLQGRFAEQYPYSRESPQNGGNFGIGLYSRVPFQSAEIDYFNDARIASVIARVNLQDSELVIIATHTRPPVGAGGFAHRNRHLRMLADRVQEFRKAEPDVPVVVMGDLNLTPWSPVFADFAERAGLAPSRGRELTSTWYRFPLFPFGLVLDHVLATPDLTRVNYQVGSDMGSDHRMVTTGWKF